MNCPICDLPFSEDRIYNHLAYFHKFGLAKAKSMLEELKKNGTN